MASPVKQSHFLPRTSEGWIALAAFVALLALAQPPVVHRFANRVEPWILGLPFLYAWLLGIYVALIGVLFWVHHKRL